MPKCLFVNGNSSENIKNGTAMMNDKAIQTTKAVFGEGSKDEEKLGRGVAKQYGIGINGFNVSSCQFAQHYFFETATTFQNYIRNVSECTKIGGYYIGTCYDGKTIFNMLKSKNRGENIELYNQDVKIWEVVKDYDNQTIQDDATSLGIKIQVYQESIGSLIPEYLVNFDYLVRIMENYGFVLINREEAKSMNLPNGTGFFGEMYNIMMNEIKRNKNEKEYGNASFMRNYEKTISFYNRYFVFKKIRNVDVKKIALDVVEFNDEPEDEMLSKTKEQEQEKEKEKEPIIETVKPKKVTKPRVKKLTNKTILLVEPEEISEPKPEIIAAIKEVEASNMDELVVTKDDERVIEEEKKEDVQKSVIVSTKKTSRKKKPTTKTEDKEDKPETIKKTKSTAVKSKLKSIEKESENVLESLILNIPEMETPSIETSTKPKKSQTTKVPKKNTTKKQKLSFVIEEKTP